jgi:hypothetical protein
MLLAVFMRNEAGAASLSETIDREIKAVWTREKLTPPVRSSDAVFLRRIYLDLVGMIPGWEETTTFLADTDPQKRANSPPHSPTPVRVLSVSGPAGAKATS